MPLFVVLGYRLRKPQELVYGHVHYLVAEVGLPPHRAKSPFKKTLGGEKGMHWHPLNLDLDCLVLAVCEVVHVPS